MRARLVAGLVAVLVAGAALAGDSVIRVNFAEMPDGRPPVGFRFGRTGDGEQGTWVIRDKVLAQTSTDNTDCRFPVALYEGGE